MCQPHSFSGQVSRQCVNISIAMDGIVEPDESFNVVLEILRPTAICRDFFLQCLGLTTVE